MNISNGYMTTSNSIGTNSDPEISLNNTLNSEPTGKQVITIGSNIWLDAGTTIFKGIITGTSSLVSTGLLVNKPVTPYQIWAGSPASFVCNQD